MLTRMTASMTPKGQEGTAKFAIFLGCIVGFLIAFFLWHHMFIGFSSTGDGWLDGVSAHLSYACYDLISMITK